MAESRENGNDLLGSVIGWEFLDELSDFSRMNVAAWNELGTCTWDDGSFGNE